MATIVALDNVTHKDLKIITNPSAEFGNNVGCVLTFPTEFAQVQREYPIFFQRQPTTGRYQSVVLLGITENENLFLRGNQWHANYVPAVVTSEPFIIGFEDQSISGGSEHAPVVYVDMDSPRISRTQGEMVFREFGGNTPYLEKVVRNLHALYQGVAAGDLMFQLFSELNLIEPVDLEIKLINGDAYRLRGNYTVNAEKLAALSGSDLERLNKAGILECAFFVATSINNMQNLIDIKNRQILARLS